MGKDRAFAIRRATEADYSAVSRLEELEYDTHRRARPDYFSRTADSYTREEFEELLRSPNPICWLAEDGGEVVGL